MGVRTFVASVAGAAYLGFAGWQFSLLSMWAMAWAIVFLWTHRSAMLAATVDRRQPNDPPAVALLSYATVIAGVTGLFFIVNSATSYLGRAVVKL